MAGPTTKCSRSLFAVRRVRAPAGKARVFIAILLAIGLSALLPPTTAKSQDAAGSMPEIVEESLDSVGAQEIEEFVSEVDRQVSQVFEDIDFRALIYRTPGVVSLDAKAILSLLAQVLGRELAANLMLLGQLILVAALSGVLGVLQEAFDKHGTAEVGYLVCYLVLTIIGINSFRIAINMAVEAVDSMVSFMYGAIPALLTLLASLGGVTSVALLHPTTIAVTAGISTVVKTVVLPLIFLSAVLTLVSRVSKRVQVTRLAGLVRGGAIGVMGVFMTVFIGVTTVRGVSGSVADAVAIKAAKFLSSTFIPVIGKMFADAVEVVAGSSLLIKSVMGIIGLLGIFLICIYPVLKITAIVFMYRIGAAVVQPVSDERLTSCLDDLASGLTLVGLAVGLTGLMFFINLTIIVSLGSVTVMLR